MTSSLRPHYWYCLSGGYKSFSAFGPSYYYDMSFAPCDWEKDIKKDIDRTFTSSTLFREKQG